MSMSSSCNDWWLMTSPFVRLCFTALLLWSASISTLSYTSRVLYWNSTIRYWKLYFISCGFRVICDYSLQWEFLHSAPKWRIFGRPIPLKRTDLILVQGQTTMSPRSIWRITDLRALLPIGVMAHSVHFLGHVLRFRSNRCYGNHGTCVSRKHDTKFIFVAHWEFVSSISHRCRVICDYFMKPCLHSPVPFIPYPTGWLQTRWFQIHPTRNFFSSAGHSNFPTLPIIRFHLFLVSVWHQFTLP